MQASCAVDLFDIELANCFDDSQLTAKRQAAERALQGLRASNWSILKKQHAESDDSRLGKSELIGDDVTSGAKSKQRIPDSNIGNKLLRQMGWTGGGVGAKGNEGRAEPVSVDAVVNRSGLGLTSSLGVTREFTQTMRRLLMEFVADVSEREDMAFASDFGRDERASIHAEARKLGLKSQSFGKDESRYLVVSRKRSPLQLLQHILDAGGETAKYKLIPPGQHPALTGSEGVQWNTHSSSNSQPPQTQ